jgi:hypothetical protein
MLLFFLKVIYFFFKKIDLVYSYMSMEQTATSVAQYRICFSYYLCDGPAISNVLFVKTYC